MVLDRFSPATREWFRGAFPEPTPAQLGAWDAISTGAHALVVAPTGSGKTLAAFLWALDQLTGDPERAGTSVLYISPLKALGVDVERNLRSPLVGIAQTARRLGMPVPDVSVGVRSGDTTPAERRVLARTPPDILITTPESLYLMLTSAARATLAGVRTVIVDEVHAVAATKRGAHLALSLERLDALLAKPAQRVGLSATVRPLDEVARFLGGRAPVTIVQPPAAKTFDLRVTVPVDDLREPDATFRGDDPLRASEATGSIWPHVEEAVLDEVLAHRSTIVFANSRRLAERLTARLNELYEERVLRPEAAPLPEPTTLTEPTPLTEPRTLTELVEVSERSTADGRFESLSDRSAPDDRDSRMPAEIMAQAGATTGAPPLLARAHHGSVSKEQRAEIEDALKSGRLRCVVATSSLELGIDMGAVDLVVQVESPPSVASGLQRIGRAGHRVGDISKGVVFPKHRTDLVHASVAVERMLSGLIEAIAVPANPLDVLAQQTVAASALGPLDVEEWFDTVRRSAPFATLPRSAFDATLDLVSGRYPSDEFAELRPRVTWDRVAGTLTGRPGAQRLAVTSGGTIPDRGLFGVFAVGASTDSATGGGRRVGELDEEMVYESRVGDVFALGTTSWRIEDITHDRVLVTPAFGQPGKVPFWKGDGLGRPAELGQAIGAFVRDLDAGSLSDSRSLNSSGGPRGVARTPPFESLRASPSTSSGSGGTSSGSGGTSSASAGIPERLAAIGLDERAASNLLTLVREQRDATGHVPTDTTLVVERFRDELGDWRLVLHSPYGMPVNAPWALAVNARVRDRLGVDGAAMAGDDGIVVRIPETDADPPGADLFAFETDELEQSVTDEVGGSALFAARFRECAARALLLPRRDPGRRSPLWQQRQRASQLLDVARKYPSFPIVLETVREVLQDVYDLPALKQLNDRIQARRVRVVEVETPVASPFARSLLFGYVAAFLYEGDSPLAERRAAALSLDPALLAELLGRTELRELLDPGVIEQVEAELQRLAPDRRARDAEGVADLLRMLGPLSEDEVAARTLPELGTLPELVEGDAPGLSKWGERGNPTGRFDTLSDPTGRFDELSDRGGRFDWLSDRLRDLERANRILPVTIAGAQHWAAIEDASRLRDALGVPLPIGVPTAFVEPVADPLGDLIGRYARTHGPFTAQDAADRFGLGVAVVTDTLRRLAADGRVVDGEFRPGASGTEWVSSEVLRRLRSRSLAALRREVEPVEASALARFLPDWQHVSDGSSGTLRGVDGVAQVVDQLAGVALPASAWESLVLPARVRDYSPAWLDELTTSGEVVWAGAGSLAGHDGWVSLHPADRAPLTLPEPDEFEPDPMQARLLAALEGGGAYFFRQLGAVAGGADDKELLRALWDLVWAGRVTNDSFAGLRAWLGGPARSRTVRVRGRSVRVAQSGPPAGTGRWSLLPPAETDPTLRGKAIAEALLERHGVVTRGAVASEGVRGGFGHVYRVLSRFEESGRVRRGYIVAGLGAAQFATGPTVDRMRSFSLDPDAAPPLRAVTLAATDPANPYGAALPWPRGEETPGHRPGRKAGALVTLVDGELALFVERGGKSVLTFGDDPAVLAAASTSLVATVRARLGRMRIEKIDGEFAVGTALGAMLADAGFAATPQGLRLRG